MSSALFLLALLFSKKRGPLGAVVELVKKWPSFYLFKEPAARMIAFKILFTYFAGEKKMSSSPLWLCLTILGLASVGIISNVACIAILTLKKRSSMFHNLLKVFLYIYKSFTS